MINLGGEAGHGAAADGITDPDLVPVAVIRALGLPDQPGRSTMETLLRFIGDRQLLVVLDDLS